VVPALIVAVALTAGAPGATSATGAAPPVLPVQGRPVIAAIQVHGNTVTTDDEVRGLAGVAIGAPFEEATTEEVAARLRATKRFVRVQTLKRFASIDDPTQILLVIIVDEGAVEIRRTSDPDHPVQAVRTGRPKLMFLPVLSAEDGYGATYGAQFAWPAAGGRPWRVSLPLTWGGDKRAAAEFDTTIDGGPIDRVSGGAAISRRTNPHYHEDDDRTRLWIRGERAITPLFRAGASTGWQRASLLGAAEGFAHVGADLTFDTRVDPNLPRNAVFARAAWEHLVGANRLDLDARGYLGLPGQAILALRAQRSDADRSLPPYLKPLLGGMANLRGFAAGTAAGDILVATSAEVIVPLTSPISFGRMGVAGFTDAGTAYDHGERLARQNWKEGIGGSVWFAAAFLRLNVAVAHGRGSSTRVHFGGNVTF
jgi:outer membrane protein assembly factor BamA